MPDPFFIGGLIAKGIGGILGANAASDEGEAYAQASEYNGKLAMRNARVVVDQMTEDVYKERILARRQIGSIRAAYGASGVTSDNSALDVLQNSAANAEHNINDIQRQARSRISAFQEDARMDREKAANYRAGGSTKAAATLLSTGGGIADSVDNYLSRLKRG